jgi:hypothetical protein
MSQGGPNPSNASQNRATVLTLAALVVVVLAIMWFGPGLANSHASGAGSRGRFYTGSAREEPTRSYVPYTGTVPYGPWGGRPWAEAA